MTRDFAITPDLFRNIGCGALLLLTALLPQYSLLLEYLTTAVAGANKELQSFELVLSILIIFSCYIVGSVCVVFGESLTDILPNRALERDIELQALVASRSIEVLSIAGMELKKKTDNLHAGIGFGALMAVSQLTILYLEGWDELRAFLTFFGVVIIVSSLVRVIWLRNKFQAYAGLIGPS